MKLVIEVCLEYLEFGTWKLIRVIIMFLNILFYLTFLSFSLGQLGRLAFLNQQVNVYIYEILLGIIFAYFLYDFFVSLRLKWSDVTIGLRIEASERDLFKQMKTKGFLGFARNDILLAIIFLVYLTGDFLIKINSFSVTENIVGALYLFRLFFYFVFLIMLLNFLKKNKQYLPTIKKGLLMSLVLTIIFSVVQYFFYPNLGNLSYLGWDPHLYRVFGTFLEPVVLSGILSIFLFFLISVRNGLKPFPTESKPIKICLIAIIFILILLTFSRGVYLAFLLTSAIFLISRNKKYILYLLMIFIAFVLLLPKPEGEGVNLMRNSTIKSRIADYSQAIEVWKKDPIFGVGYNRIRYIKTDITQQESNNHAGASFHSSFLIMLVSGGIIGLILYLIVLIKIAQINSYAFYSVFFLSIASLTDNLLLHPFILFILFTMIAYSINFKFQIPSTPNKLQYSITNNQ